MTAPTSPDERMWTARIRRRAVAALPPEQLLPDRQPSHVASWIYVFGVLALAALLVVLVSGGILALEGPQWYHTSPEGHFINSLHLWSVEPSSCGTCCWCAAAAWCRRSPTRTPGGTREGRPVDASSEEAAS